MPASRSAWRRPVISAIAQPWEKPATTIRSAGMPRAFSLRDQRLDRGLRAAQAGLVFALHQVGPRMSYQAGMR